MIGMALSPASAVAQNDIVLRVLAYNIRHGAGIDDSVDLRRAAAVINRLRPDLVALQEIDSATTRTAGIDQARRLGTLTDMNAVFGGFMEYREGQYGMALLSRYPIVEFTNHRLPDGLEPRTALAIAVQPTDFSGSIVMVGIHLYATEAERLAQAERLIDIFADDPRPVVLVGDFNSQPESPVIDLLSQRWSIPPKSGNRLTFPSDQPAREIDYVMLRPASRFEVLEYRVIDEPIASDHRPVLLVVRLLEQRQ
jgi:endonuclease/exonuclease/phosphatase family metal-dependent hydrolase